MSVEEVIDLSGGMPLDEEDERELQSSNEKLIVLKKLLGDQDILKAGLEWFEETSFFIDHPMCFFIWGIIYEYIHDYRQLPSLDILIEECKMRFPGFRAQHADTTSLELNEIISFIKEALAEENTVNKTDIEVLYNILQQHGTEYLGREFQEGIEKGQNPVELFNTLSSVLTNPLQKPKKKKILLPLQEQAELFAANPKYTLHIGWMDDLFDGGLMKGDSVGWVMPTAGGKTTMVWQAAYKHALAEEHAVVTTFEQNYSEDLMLRNCVLASGAPRSIWAKVYPEKGVVDLLQLPEENRRRYNELIELINTYVHVVDDFTEEGMPIRSIRELYDKSFQQAYDEDPNADVMLFEIDWWGPLKTRLLTSMPSTFKGESMFRFYQQECQRAFKIQSQEHEVRTFVFQQLSGKESAKRSGGHMSSHNAQEDKSFNNMFDYGVVTSKPDPTTGSMTAVVDKARGAKSKKIHLIMDGNYCLIRSDNIEQGGSLIETMHTSDTGLENNLDSMFLPAEEV